MDVGDRIRRGVGVEDVDERPAVEELDEDEDGERDARRGEGACVDGDGGEHDGGREQVEISPSEIADTAISQLRGTRASCEELGAAMADDADTLKTLKAELSAAKTDPENFAERASAVSSSAIEVLRGAAAATAPSLPVAVHAMRVLKVASDAHSVADASAAVHTFVDGALLPRLGCAAGAEAAQLQQVCRVAANTLAALLGVAGGARGRAVEGVDEREGASRRREADGVDALAAFLARCAGASADARAALVDHRTEPPRWPCASLRRRAGLPVRARPGGEALPASLSRARRLEQRRVLGPPLDDSSALSASQRQRRLEWAVAENDLVAGDALALLPPLLGAPRGAAPTTRRRCRRRRSPSASPASPPSSPTGRNCPRSTARRPPHATRSARSRRRAAAAAGLGGRRAGYRRGFK